MGIAEEHYATFNARKRNEEESADIKRYNHLVDIVEEALPLLVAKTKDPKTMPQDHQMVVIDKSTGREEIAWAFNRDRYLFLLQSGDVAYYSPTHGFRGEEPDVLKVEHISSKYMVGAFIDVKIGTEGAVLSMSMLEQIVDGIFVACHWYGVKYQKRWYRDGNEINLSALMNKRFWAK